MPKLPNYSSPKFQRLLLLITLLFIFAFAFRPDQDSFVYHCYAKTFWQGGDSLVGNTQQQCHVFLSNVSPAPFHTIPSEYPIYSLAIFSLPLLLPFFPYHLVFAGMILLVVLWLFFYTKRNFSQKNVFLLLISLLIMSATVGGRYDLFPAVLTMLSLVAVEKKHFTSAYLLLLAGTLLKLYPLLLLLPFFLAEQQTIKSSVFQLKRYKNSLLFVGGCAMSLLLAWMLSPQNWIQFIEDPFIRPYQVESTAASLLWLSSFFSHDILHIVFTYGSLALIPNQELPVFIINGILLGTVGFLGIMLLKHFVQGRLTLLQTAIALLLLFMSTGKVFSPQYFLWLIPLVVIGKHFTLPWLGLWLGLLLTTALLHPWMYPFIVANMHRPTIILEEHLFFFVAMIRNILLFTALAYWLTKKK